MLKTVITRAPNERVREIFKSNAHVEFHFFSYYKYESLPINKNFIKNIHQGYFDWIVITSYKSWELLIKQLDNSNMDIPKQTKIAAFGPETARRIVQLGREVNFIKNVKNSKYFASLLAELLEEDSKIAYPASSSAGGQIEEIFSQANMQIIRQNIYKPNSILDDNKIAEMIYDSNLDSIVFLSAASVKLFIEKCSEESLNKIKNMKLFAIGAETASMLEKYKYQDISTPDYPSIKDLSKIIYNFSEGFSRE